MTNVGSGRVRSKVYGMESRSPAFSNLATKAVGATLIPCFVWASTRVSLRMTKAGKTAKKR